MRYFAKEKKQKTKKNIHAFPDDRNATTAPEQRVWGVAAEEEGGVMAQNERNDREAGGGRPSAQAATIKVKARYSIKKKAGPPQGEPRVNKCSALMVSSFFCCHPLAPPHQKTKQKKTWLFGMKWKKNTKSLKKKFTLARF